MGDFSQRALAIQPTGVRKMFDLAGDDVISFGLGEPDFQPPPIAIEAFHQAMLDGRNKYTTTAGLPPLRAKIAQSWHHLEDGLTEDNVCITMFASSRMDICTAPSHPRAPMPVSMDISQTDSVKEYDACVSLMSPLPETELLLYLFRAEMP